MALAPEVAPNIVQRLKLPTVGSDPRNRRGKGTSNDQWVFQSYADFASKAEKRNSEVEFDKTLMDVAFRYQVNKVVPLSPKKRAGPNGGPSLEKMLTRVSEVCVWEPNSCDGRLTGCGLVVLRPRVGRLLGRKRKGTSGLGAGVPAAG